MRPTILRRPPIVPATPPPVRPSRNPIKRFRSWRDRTWHKYNDLLQPLGVFSSVSPWYGWARWEPRPAPTIKFTAEMHRDLLGVTWQISTTWEGQKLVVSRGWGRSKREAYDSCLRVMDAGMRIWPYFSALPIRKATATTGNNLHTLLTSWPVTLVLGRKVPTTYVH